MRLTFIVLVLILTFLSIYCLDLNQYETSNQNNRNERFKRNARNAYFRNLSNIKRNLNQQYRKIYKKCIGLQVKNQILDCIEDLKGSAMNIIYENKYNLEDELKVENRPYLMNSNLNNQLNSNALVLQNNKLLEDSKTLKTIVSYGPDYSNNNANYSPQDNYSSSNYNKEERRSRSRTRSRSRSKSRSRSRSIRRSRSRSTRRSRSLIARRNRLRQLFCNDDIDRRDDSICRVRNRRVRNRALPRD